MPSAMDGDDASETLVAQLTSTGPGSPIAVDSAVPAESANETTPPATSHPEPMVTEVPEVEPTAGDGPTSIQSDNTGKHEKQRDSSPSPPPPSVIEIDKAPDQPVSAEPSAPKPKSRGQKARTPSPPPAPPPPPLTVRLTIELGGPSNYQVNILGLAKETGQRHPTPPPVRRDSDTSEDEDDDDNAGNASQSFAAPGTDQSAFPKRRRRRRRQDPDEYYDVEDPFIDDSDLGIDAPTHFAQTKQKGFYVNSGDVTLVLDEPEPVVKKQRKRRAFIPEMPSFLAGKGKSHANEQPGSSNVAQVSPSPNDANSIEDSGAAARDQQSPIPRMVGDGTRDSPIALLDDGDPKVDSDEYHETSAKRMKMANGERIGLPNTAQVPITTSRAENADNARKRKHSNIATEPLRQFSPELQKEFVKLRQLITEADFTVKSKFPPQLREPLAATAIRAVELEEYGEAFFKHLPEIFPYNKFTMTKLVKRLVYERHTEILNERMDSLLDNLRLVVENGFPAAQQGYKDDLAKWEDKQKRRQKQPDEDSGTPSSTPFVTVDGAESASARRERGDAPPQQRYKLTDEIKNLIWQLVTINNELASMTNTMHEWEPDNHPAVSDQSMRKNLYQRIVGVFPEGWINTGLISREFSNMKRKVQMADEQSE